VTTPFGQLLRQWRTTRGWSQATLSERARVAPRHLSFLETGRSRPGDEVAHRLADALELGHRHENELFAAVGLEPLWADASPDHVDAAAYSQVIQQVLHAHDPYPALVIDRAWNLLDANRTARCLFRLPEAGGLSGGALLEAFVGPEGVYQLLLNRGEVAWHLRDRLHAELRARPSAAVKRLLARMDNEVLAATPRPPLRAQRGLTIEPTFRLGDVVVRTLSTLTHFTRVYDVQLDEVRVEQFFPLAPASKAFFHAI